MFSRSLCMCLCTHTYIFSQPLKVVHVHCTCTCPLTSKYFSMYFLKTRLSYITTIQIWKSGNLTLLQYYVILYLSPYSNFTCCRNGIHYFFSSSGSNPGSHVAFSCHAPLDSFNLEEIFNFPNNFHHLEVVCCFLIRFSLIYLFWSGQEYHTCDIMTSVHHHTRRTWCFIPLLVMLTLMAWLVFPAHTPQVSPL